MTYSDDFKRAAKLIKRKAKDCESFCKQCINENNFLEAYGYAKKYHSYIKAIQIMYEANNCVDIPEEDEEFIKCNENNYYGLMIKVGGMEYREFHGE